MEPRDYQRTRRNRATRACALLAAVVYIVSFFLPAVAVFSDPIAGWQAYLFVTLAPWDAKQMPLRELVLWLVYWLPNPLLWVGIFFLARGRPGGAAWLGLVALAAGLGCTFDADQLRFNFSDCRVGYYCWLASMALVAGAGGWHGLRPFFQGVSAEPEPLECRQQVINRAVPGPS